VRTKCRGDGKVLSADHHRSFPTCKTVSLGYLEGSAEDVLPMALQEALAAVEGGFSNSY